MRGASLMVALALVSLGCSGKSATPSIVVGTASPEPAPVQEEQVGEPEIPAPEVEPDPGLARATGSGPRGASAWTGAVDVPGHLLFFLVIGSDARPGQNVERSRADAITVAAVDPATRRGTVLGIPRDAYVNVPGHGQRKINSALALGGPQLLVRTVREVTGLPISHFALTGFEGMVRMVDELGGLDVNVPRRMNDRNSGARFEPGWHHMDGRQVLAFTRNRNLPGGDLERAANHGRVVLHALEKLRAETSDEAGVRRFLGHLMRHARLDMSMGEAVRFGSLARNLDPRELVAVVAPGRHGKAGSQSVVYLTEEAFRLFRDVGADAVADGRTQPSNPSPT
ncbi:MAG TPA: LCP family protein, partial [Actinomycetota bacterium]|nr:LCP family protein [Actinomycetota bacterium]